MQNTCLLTGVCIVKYWFFDGNDVVGPFTPQELAARTDFSAASMICAEGTSEDSAGWQPATFFKTFRFNSYTGRLARLLESEPVMAQVATAQHAMASSSAGTGINTSSSCQMPMVEVSPEEYTPPVLQAGSISPVSAEDGGKSAALLQQILQKKLGPQPLRIAPQASRSSASVQRDRLAGAVAILPARPATQAILRTAPSPLLMSTPRALLAAQVFADLGTADPITPPFTHSAGQKWILAAGLSLAIGGGCLLWYFMPALFRPAQVPASSAVAAATTVPPVSEGRLAQQAIAAVQNYPLNENRRTVREYFAQVYATQADSSDQQRWSAQPAQNGLYIVKYKVEQPPAPPAIYLFEVESSSGRVTGALNQATADLMGNNL